MSSQETSFHDVAAPGFPGIEPPIDVIQGLEGTSLGLVFSYEEREAYAAGAIGGLEAAHQLLENHSRASHPATAYLLHLAATQMKAEAAAASELLERQHTMDATLEAMMIDTKTKLPRHEVFEAAYHDLQLSEAEAGRRRGDKETAQSREHSLIMLDLDHFKAVNDTYGHIAGDQVLGIVGEIVRGRLRKTDTAARFGGEEIVILLPHTSEEQAAKIAENLRWAIGGTIIITPSGRLINITASLGVAIIDPRKSLAENTARADQAVYEAKNGQCGRKGRNQVVRHSSLTDTIIDIRDGHKGGAQNPPSDGQPKSTSEFSWFEREDAPDSVPDSKPKIPPEAGADDESV